MDQVQSWQTCWAPITVFLLLFFLLGLPSSIHLIQNVKLFFVMQSSILKDLYRNNSFIIVPKLLSDGIDSHTSLTAWGWTHDSDLQLIISSLLFRSLICRNYLKQGPFSKEVPDHHVVNLSLLAVFLCFHLSFADCSVDSDGTTDNGIKITDIVVLTSVIHSLMCWQQKKDSTKYNQNYLLAFLKSRKHLALHSIQ